MAGLNAKATAPGPSPLQEQAFFGLLILLMLICLLRSGCAAEARTLARRTEARCGRRACRSKDDGAGSNKKVRYSSRARSAQPGARRHVLETFLSCSCDAARVCAQTDGAGSSDDEDGDVVSDKSD